MAADNKTKSASLVSKEYIVPFALITSLFFLWGFARSILDVLNKHFQDAFEMTRTQSSLIQVSVYLAYFLMAIPAGLYINRKGYRKGVVFGLILYAIGALLFIPSDMSMSFDSFLISLFVLGCGLVFLETAANPYVTELGDPATAASRLNLSQSFNGLGCICGPFIGGMLLFPDSGPAQVALPYAVMGVVVFAVALVFSRVKLPEIKRIDEESGNIGESSIMGLWRKNRFVFGLVALFCYEIAEISINTFFINYVTDDGWLDVRTASMFLAFGGLGLFMLGRVIGSFVMSRIAAEKVLLVCGVVTVVCTLLIVLNIGSLSKIALPVCYLFESIMFPTVFAISLKGLGHYTKRAASFLMMTPIGGAVGAFLMGYVGDVAGMSNAFVVPMIGYAVVMSFAAWAKSAKAQ